MLQRQATPAGTMNSPAFGRATFAGSDVHAAVPAAPPLPTQQLLLTSAAAVRAPALVGAIRLFFGFLIAMSGDAQQCAVALLESLQSLDEAARSHPDPVMRYKCSIMRYLWRTQPQLTPIDCHLYLAMQFCISSICSLITTQIQSFGPRRFVSACRRI